MGRAVGANSPRLGAGSFPSTLKIDRSPNQIPTLSPAGTLPPLQITSSSESRSTAESESAFEATGPSSAQIAEGTATLASPPEVTTAPSE